MLLISATVGPFKSINEQQKVSIDTKATVLVGMNEAGKTIFLQALEKANDAVGVAEFNPIEDYPRKDLTAYQKVHDATPADVVTLTYQLGSKEIAQLNSELKVKVPADFKFSLIHNYANTKKVSLSVDEGPVVKALISGIKLSSDAAAAVKKAQSVREIPALLKAVTLEDGDKAFLAEIETRVKNVGSVWESVVGYEVWGWLSPKVPKFLFFGEYDLLPDKTNLPDLAARVERAKSDPSQLTPGHRAVLALLRMADIGIADLTKAGGYEPLKAKIEAVSISLTDQVLEFWKQNEFLEVEVDIKPDSTDTTPYNSGANLYLRIKNRKHRGVSTPFGQRSRGFIWFFSFLVWFDDVKSQLTSADKSSKDNLILLLDEPGLALHALAQKDFLGYIDSLTERHQVLYTTHSPFMMHNDRLNQIRVVEDIGKVGTVVSENVSGSDSRTIFPLQAALGWNIAQNLFVSKRNLLVEGPSDLVYLKTVSGYLEGHGKEGLRDDVVIVPTGGLDKVATFIALLGANGLSLAVLHDFRGTPDKKLFDLVKHKMISNKAILNASQFKDLKNIGEDGQPADIEDLFGVEEYLHYFNMTFARELKGGSITEKDLPAGDRVIERLERYLANNSIALRASGGFNHYRVASSFASTPPKSLDTDTVKRYEALFRVVNSLFPK